MKLTTLNVALGLAAIAGFSATAQAGGWHYGAGGYKDYVSQAAVSVPAPSPIPVYSADYYFRGDVGVSLSDGPDASENGLTYGQGDARNARDLEDRFVQEDFGSYVTIGVGIGRYFSDRFRGDITAEYFSQGKVNVDRNESYERYDHNNNAWFAPSRNGRHETRDITSLRGGIFMANGYYDLASYGRFRPYVGGGLGFAWNELSRHHTTTAYRDTNGDGDWDTESTRSFKEKTHDLTLAANVTIGATYNFSERGALDLNYRYLYVGGTGVSLGIDGNTYGGRSTVEIDDRHEHQLRAGLRWNVY